MWELDHKEGWVPKNLWFRIVVLGKTLESPLDSKEIKPVNPKGNQPWLFTGRTVAETPKLWPPNEKSQLIAKDPDARKDWSQEEKGMIEDERWHHWLNGHEFEQTLGDSEGQGRLGAPSMGSQRVGNDLVTEQQAMISRKVGEMAWLKHWVTMATGA